ncbi:MAG: alpha/beta hydrolase [Chloroflexota bacterium]
MSLIPASPHARRDRVAARIAGWAVQASLLVSPRPAALLVRRIFADESAERTREQLATAPPVRAELDRRYGQAPDEVLDLYAPLDRADGQFPLIVWVHGGAFVGGSKEELGGYLRRLAARGFVVAAPGYTLAPEARYPTPIRQTLAACQHLGSSAADLGIDASRVVLAGDSAGAQIAAQTAGVLTNARYAARLGLAPTLDAASLRGAILCCGIFDLGAIRTSGPLGALVRAAAWAYSGERTVRPDGAFATTASVDAYLSAAFPPAFVTAGNADPLLPQSQALADRLDALGIAVERRFFPPGHTPPLGHEYQLHLDLEAAREAFEQIAAFAARATSHSAAPP